MPRAGFEPTISSLLVTRLTNLAIKAFVEKLKVLINMWIRYKNNEMIRTIGKWVYTPQYHSILGILPYQCGGKANIITDAVQEREGKKNYRDWGRSIEILYEQCASLKQLVRVLLSVNLWYQVTRCYEFRRSMVPNMLAEPQLPGSTFPLDSTKKEHLLFQMY